jgi:biopolymer transport protein ExbD
MNTTPLIDVMLVLLTLLIITLPLQSHAVKLDLNNNPAKTVPPPVVNIAVEFDGTTTWNGMPVDRVTLDSYLSRAARQTPQPELHVLPNRLAKYEVVAKVLSDAQRLGLTQIGFADTQQFAPN